MPLPDLIQEAQDRAAGHTGSPSPVYTPQPGEGEFRGAWKPNTYYGEFDQVISPVTGNTVYANVEHASGSTFAAGASKWTAFPVSVEIGVQQEGEDVGAGKINAVGGDEAVDLRVLDEVLWGHDERFGGPAEGDGTTDDAAALQAKCDRARDVGGQVKLKPGRYVLASTLEPNSSADQDPVLLSGAGPIGAALNPSLPVTLTRPAGTTHTLVRGLGKGLWLENLCFDGAGEAGMLFETIRGFELRMRNLIFYNARHTALMLRSLANPDLSHLHVEKCGATTKTFADGAMTAGQKTLAGAGTFTSADVGKIAIVPGAGTAGGAFASEIESVQSATSVTLRTAAVTTVSAAACTAYAAAVRVTGGASQYGSSSNYLACEEVHLERNAGTDLDLAFGTDADSIAEFLRFGSFHIESTNDGPAGVYKTDPLIRVGNTRGVDLVSPFLYGGAGPLITYDRYHGIGSQVTDGLKLIGGYLLGHTSATAGQSPDRLVDLVRGDGFISVGTEYDTAITEHVRVRSTFGKRAWIIAPNHKTRTGATTTYLTDDRGDDSANREACPIPSSLVQGDLYVRAGTGARYAHIDAPAGQAAGLRLDRGGVNRWELRQSTGAESGGNNGSELELVARDDTGALIATAFTVIRKNQRFILNGTLGRKRRSVAGNVTVAAGDSVIEISDTSAPRTVTLPSASSFGAGGELIIKDTSGGAGTNAITIARAGTDTIDGATSATINTNYGVLRLMSDGTGAWRLI